MVSVVLLWDQVISGLDQHHLHHLRQVGHHASDHHDGQMFPLQTLGTGLLLRLRRGRLRQGHPRHRGPPGEHEGPLRGVPGGGDTLHEGEHNHTGWSYRGHAIYTGILLQPIICLFYLFCLLQFLGFVFSFCLANSIKKECEIV